MTLTAFQQALELKTGWLGTSQGLVRKPRKTVKFCNRCGGTHNGLCDLKATVHGTFCRPEILEIVEHRARERR